MKARSILLAAVGALAMTSLAAPVLAQPYDRDDWHGHHDDHWRGHEGREHRGGYYAPGYYAPRAYYAPPPPVVYGSPGVTFGITIP